MIRKRYEESHQRRKCNRRAGTSSSAVDRALVLLCPVLAIGDHALLDRLRAQARAAGVQRAVATRDTPALFDWLIGLLQLQGISDRSAFAFSARVGLPTFAAIARALDRWPADFCPRLHSYWHFADCGFRRSAGTCANPPCYGSCFLPRLPARNGRLAQGAMSFFLFLRDVCDNDLVGWIDGRLAVADDAAAPDRHRRLGNALLEPLGNVYGVSDKVLSMALADLLLAGDPERERWVAAGAGMIAVDTLVHNFLTRTGILGAFGAEHAYGPACYAEGGCATIIDEIARHIDARQFNSNFPPFFPRFVQHAIWLFCAADGHDICNGNRIDDRIGCRNMHCPVGSQCTRARLG